MSPLYFAYGPSHASIGGWHEFTPTLGGSCKCSRRSTASRVPCGSHDDRAVLFWISDVLIAEVREATYPTHAYHQAQISSVHSPIGFQPAIRSTKTPTTWPPGPSPEPNRWAAFPPSHAQSFNWISGIVTVSKFACTASASMR